MSGCGGGSAENVAEVTGQVTIDGQPLSNARIQFVPVAGGSPSFGMTDAQGNYKLTYTRDVEGAIIGEHTVNISTYVEADPDREPPVTAVPEKVPARYNVKTELKKTVEDGSNTIDFPLEGKGEIISPEQLARADRSDDD
jgi:hypothetical protein